MYPSSATLCELFAQAVERCPDNLAVDHEQGCLTYRELCDSSTVLARTLIHLGASKTSPVILVTAHGSFNIIAILAILKAGSSFVPIDRGSWPTERINQVFETVQSSLVINTTVEPFAPPYGFCHVLDIGSVPSFSPFEQDLIESSSTIDPEDTACILFTSGSTGRPKGVMLSHRSLCLYSQTSPLNMNIRPGDRLIHILSVAFDACACILFSALCNGGTVVPAEPADLYQKATSCTVMAATPSLLNNLPIPTSDDRIFSNIHTVILGGETASPDLLGSWIDAGVQMFTAYGLSETTSMGTIHRVERDPDTGKINPFIVGPFMNESPIYLLDQNSTQIVEENVDGEIVIGGSSIAKGYYMDDCKTKDSFIDWEGLRVYKTGDYGRWVRGRSDNRLLEFIGRRDRSIKSSGFTINLDRDVEEKLYLAGVSLGVKSVHSVATKSGIVAVVTPSCVDTTVLFENARKTMCSYCVPSRIEAIEEVPLSASGKVQSKGIMDIIDKIDNDRIAPASICPVTSIVSGNSTTQAPADEGRLPEVLRATAQVLGCLGRELQGITGKDSFIGIGGTSLLAIRLIYELRRLKLHISVRDLFVCRTFTEVAERASTTTAPNLTTRWITEDPFTASVLTDLRAKACVDLGYDNTKFDIGPLTSLQLELAVPTLSDATMNINQAKLSYGWNVVHTAERAWSTVWRAEPVFRTEISLAIGSGAHIVHKDAIRKPDTRNYDDRGKYEAAVRDVSMSVGLGCRLDFIYYRPKATNSGSGTGNEVSHEKSELTVVLTIHHSLMDGSSLEFLLENVERTSKGRSLDCDTSSIDANLGLVATQRMHDQLARSFFSSYLKDVPIMNKAFESNCLVTQTKPTERAHRTTTARFTPSVSVEAVAEFARKISVSGACVYYCAWAMAISAYEGSENVVVGSVFSNRTAQAGCERTIGLYMATLPLVFNFKAKETVEDRLQRTMDDLVKLREFSWARSDQIGIGNRLGNLLALQLPLPNESSSPPVLRVETLENLDFPLSMLVEASGDLRILYEDRRFDIADIQRIGDHFKYALYSVLNERLIEDCMKINRLHEKLLANADFFTNQTQEETVKKALERSADRFAESVALEDCFGTILSYEELDRLSNIIGHSISEHLPDTNVIAVLGDGTITWVLSIVGVLKAGRRYVPLDPKWSIDRRATVCIESGATALLLPSKTQESEVSPIPGLKVLFTESILCGGMGTPKFSRLPNTTAPDDDLVVVYTSGSTGVPKGIPLTNRGILALLRSCPEATMFAAPGRRIAQFMSPAFDYCNIEILCTLLHGATLVLRDPCDPYAHLRRVDTAIITPSVLTVLDPNDYPNLKNIYSTGEPITSLLVCKFSTRTLLYNAYGPAECSVITSCTRVIPGDPITVGVAVPSARMYILDERQQPVPEGIKGEIFVAGTQVMRGYLRAENLSIQCVMSDPWHVRERMYRTGDFGARGHDSRIKYLGRIDRQVKLRGFRVELDEVEKTVMSIGEDEGMTQCCAVVLNGTLVAFVTCIPDKPFLESKVWITRLQDQLKERLFSASIPQAIIQLDQFPMNFNGKVDAKALESMYAKRTSDREALFASKTTDPICLRVADEWRQILQLGSDAPLRCTDNFFSLGGHSVLVLLLANRLSTAFQLEITLRELLPVPTLRSQVDLVKHLMQIKSTHNGPSEESVSGDYTRLPVEQLTELERLVWHQCQVSTTATAFHIAKILHVNGPVRVERLVESFNKALASDPVFRTNIADGPRGPERLLSKRSPTVRLVSHLDIDAELNRGFDLASDQLMRIFLTPSAQQGKGPHEGIVSSTQIVIITSHVIVDLESLQTLLRLTSQAYFGATLQVYEIPRHLESDRWTRILSPSEQEWWKDYLKGYGYHDSKAPLLCDPVRLPNAGYFNGLSRIRHYSGKLVTDLNAKTRETGTTKHQLVLTSAALMLQWFSGEYDIVLGAPDSGRRSTLEKEACGQFLDRLPIRVKLPQGATEGFSTTNKILTDVRDSAHNALANAIPFSRILESLDFPIESLADSVTTDIRLCECMVTFHPSDSGLHNWLRLQDCTVSESSLFPPGSKFPLMLEWSETGPDQWLVHIEYDTDRISAATVDGIENALDIILDAISQDGRINELREALGSLAYAR